MLTYLIHCISVELHGVCADAVLRAMGGVEFDSLIHVTTFLHATAARIIMKLLWLAILCRPDIQVAVHALGSHVTCSTRADDQRLARLIGYISVTTNYAILSFMRN